MAPLKISLRGFQDKTKSKLPQQIKNVTRIEDYAKHFEELRPFPVLSIAFLG